MINDHTFGFGLLLIFPDRPSLHLIWYITFELYIYIYESGIHVIL